MSALHQTPPSAQQEEAIYFGAPEAPCFATLHFPEGTRAQQEGWVLCAPLGQERGNAHTMMVSWAHTLCRAGYPVLHFDYRGHGDSAGYEEDFALEDHVDDTRAAVQFLEEATGRACGGLCGLRMGATIAALAAADLPSVRRLLLWEPVVDGAAYVQALLRMAMATDLAQGRRPLSREQRLEKLSAGSRITVDGHVLSMCTLETLSRCSLLHVPCRDHVLLVQFDARPTHQERPAYLDLRRHWNLDAVVEMAMVNGPLPWRLNATYDPAPDTLFTGSLHWIEREKLSPRIIHHDGHRPNGRTALAEALRAPGTPPSVLRTLSHQEGEEYPVVFHEGITTLRGILHTPARGRRHRPLLVLPPPGTDSRSGYLRNYVRLARRVSAGGWIVLRFDPPGIGVSDGVDPYTSLAAHNRYVQGGGYAPATRAAVSTFGQGRRVISGGICGGAITAILHAATDPQVAGLVLLEPQFRLAAVAGQENHQPISTYRRRLHSWAAWKRLLTFQTHYRDVWWTLKSFFRNAVKKRKEDELLRDPLINRPLIQAYRICIRRKLPILLVYGGTDDQAHYRQLKPLLYGLHGETPDCVIEHFLDEADHAFSAPQHTERILCIVDQWLNDAARGWRTKTPSTVDMAR